MTFIDLKYILTIAEEKNMTQAAKKLFISQPSLSQRVHKIESEIQTHLFIRTASGVELTESGVMFVKMAYSILHTYDNFTKQLEKTLTCEKTKLYIGIPPRQSLIVIPHLLESFACIYPNTQLVFKDISSRRIEEYLVSGEIDLGIMHLPIFSHLITYKIFQKDYLCIYLRKGSSLAEQAYKKDGHSFQLLPIQALKDELIGATYPGQRSRMILDRLFKEEGITANIVHEMQSFDNLISFADAGFCSVLVPYKSYNLLSCDPNRIFEIDSSRDISFNFAIAYCTDKPYSKIFDSIYKTLRMYFK